MDELYKCKKCGDGFRADKIASCPKCDTHVDGSALKTLSSKRQKPTMREDLIGIESQVAINLIVEAQNKTTAAVRSIAELLIMSILTSTVACLLWFLAALFNLPFVYIMACLVGLAGYSYSIFLAINNLKQSE